MKGLMRMTYKETYEKIREMAFTTRKGLANSAVRSRLIDQAKNILYNNLDDIEAALKFASEAEKQIQILELELKDAERELDELTKKTAPKKKPKAPEGDE